MPRPSDNLLRTFASVPVNSRVLDLGCAKGTHTEPLLSLGFDLYACDTDDDSVGTARKLVEERLGEEEGNRRVSQVPRLAALGYPDAFFAWVVAYDLPDSVSTREEMVDALCEVRRVLAPGGWVYLAVSAITTDFNPLVESADYANDSGSSFTFTAGTLDALAAEAGLETAESPVHTEVDRPRLEAIYRRVEADTTR